MQAALIRWGLGALGVLGLILTIYVMHLRMETLTLQRDRAQEAAAAYAQTLAAYQDQFAAQARALGSEKGREIARHENLLRTLNLIGDINENENTPVSGAALSVIDSMYGAAAAGAGNTAH